MLLPMFTFPNAFRRGAPFLASGANWGTTAALTRFTSGRRAILAVNVGRGPPPKLNTDTVKSDGLVLARKVGYDDWVRRAAAMEPIAIPPLNPMSSTTLRYPLQRRPKVAGKR